MEHFQEHYCISKMIDIIVVCLTQVANDYVSQMKPAYVPVNINIRNVLSETETKSSVGWTLIYS